MAQIVNLPQLGLSEESAVLTRWHAAKGAKVSAGDLLFSIETGKSAFDVASEVDGTVLDFFVREGDEVPVGRPVCVVGSEGESYERPAEAPVVPTPAEIRSAAAVVGADYARGQRAAVSPRARKLAERAEVDPSLALPTGPAGRVIERDVRVLIESGGEAVPAALEVPPPTPAGAFSDRPLSPLRKTIAKNMTASLREMAQLTHTASFDASVILAYRRSLKEDPELSGVTLTDMILYAVTRTLPKFPELNSWLMGDALRVFSEVNLAVAVDTDRGLMAPVIQGASGKSLASLSREMKTLAGACRDGTISPDLLAGGSFTVSNLGMYGIESFTPIINAPQTGILGVNAVTQRVRETEKGITVYPCMALSLTYDHRALDGAPASRFLQALCGSLERFTGLLAY